MLPLSDDVPARRFPVVNVSLIAANFAVWLFYELPHLNSAVYHASFYPCTVDGACRGPQPWGLSWITAMFLHGSWDHILCSAPTSSSTPVPGSAPTSSRFLVSIRWDLPRGWRVRCKLIEANFVLFQHLGQRRGVAFFAHVGGFVFGVLVAELLPVRSGTDMPREITRPAVRVQKQKEDMPWGR